MGPELVVEISYEQNRLGITSYCGRENSYKVLIEKMSCGQAKVFTDEEQLSRRKAALLRLNS